MKARAINYGRRIVRLSIGKDPTIFVIHEDLLCANSPFFRQALQPGRKDVEGDCSICLGTLKHIPQDITFCKNCGNNFHVGCMKNLLQAARGQKMSCPLCRNEWMGHKSHQSKELPEMNAAAFGTYYEWLYKDCITYTQGSEEEDKEQTLRNLLQIYQIGLEIKDEKFSTAVIEQIFEFAASESPGGYDCIRDIYNDEEDYPYLKELLVYLYIFLRIEDKSLDDLFTWEDMPTRFVRDVVVTLIEDSDLRESGIDTQTMWRRMSIYNKR